MIETKSESLRCSADNINTGEIQMADYNQIRTLIDATPLSNYDSTLQSLSDEEKHELQQLEEELSGD